MGLIDFIVEQMAWVGKIDAILLHKASQARLLAECNAKIDLKLTDDKRTLFWNIPVINHFKLNRKHEWIAAQTELSFVRDGRIIKSVTIPEKY